MPDQADRDRAARALDEFADDVIDTAVQVCAFVGIRPILTGVSIANGALGVAPNQWTTKDPLRQVEVLATTNPDRVGAGNDIAWDTDGATVGPWRRDISRVAVGTFVTGATLNSPRMPVQVAVWDLTNAVSDLPLPHAGTTRKGYAGYVPGNVATLTATTNPDNLTVWANLNWSDGGTGQQTQVPASLAGDVTYTVTLGTVAIGQLSKQVTLHICQWPLLEVTQITFSNGHVINEDTAADFDRLWTRARIGAVPPNPINPPECYTQNTRIRLTVTLRVVTPPTDAETVRVRGRATIGGVAMTWTSGDIIVQPGGAPVSFPAAVNADQPLPPPVDYYQAAQIDWEMWDPNQAWTIAIGSTTHDFYVTLGDPTGGGPVYWTLLHYSCVNARTTTAEPAFVNAAFTSYTGRNMVRKRDPKPMTYWDPQDDAGGNGNTAALLGSDTTREDPMNPGPPDPMGAQVAAGHCGSWAESFVDMLKIHGVTSGHKVNVTRVAPMRRAGGLPATVGGFLVATWDFAAAPAVQAGRLTHTQYTDCTTGAHAPGQSNLTPPPAFYNHFIVWNITTNTLYDPSYGTRFNAGGQAATLLAWEMGSISGLFADGGPPDAGYPTNGAGAPGQRLQFEDQVTNANL